MKPGQKPAWETHKEPSAPAACQASSPKARQMKAAQELTLPAQIYSRAFSKGVVNPPHLWETQKFGPQRAAGKPWEHRNLLYSTLPWAPTVRRCKMQLNRRLHSWSRSPSAAILMPFASSSLKSNKNLTSVLHISKSNKMFPSKQYQRQKLS